MQSDGLKVWSGVLIQIISSNRYHRFCEWRLDGLKKETSCSARHKIVACRFFTVFFQHLILPIMKITDFSPLFFFFQNIFIDISPSKQAYCPHIATPIQPYFQYQFKHFLILKSFRCKTSPCTNENYAIYFASNLMLSGIVKVYFL